MKKFFNTVILCVLFIACDKQSMPYNDGAAVPQDVIISCWEVENTAAYLRVSTLYQSLSKTFEDLLADKLMDESDGKTLCFTDEKAYCIQEHTKDSSNYYISKDTLYLTTNPDLLGFHTPYFYLKRDSTDLSRITAYLGKKESIDLLVADGSVSSYIGMINNIVEDAQCELRFLKVEQ